MNNVLILLGRGTEGTGNTRFTIELEEHLKSKNYQVDVVTSCDKNWNRTQAQDNDFIKHKFMNSAYISDKKYDTVIITSVPAKEKINAKVDKDKVIKQYDNFILTLNHLKQNGAKIVYMQVDHKIHSINRNFYVIEDYTHKFFVNLDRIITHNLNNDFVTKYIPKLLDSYNYTFDVKEQLLISCDFDEVKNFITPSTKIPKSCYFIGRSARWKGWREFRDLHYNILRHDGYVSLIDGVESSINAKQDLFEYDSNGKLTIEKPTNLAYNTANYCKNKELPVLPENFDFKNCAQLIFDDIKVNREKYINKPCFVFGPYIRKEALQRVAESKFGIFFTFIGKEYGGPLENVFLEIIAAGTIPVIRKELYESANFNGIKLSDFNPYDLGVIVYDEENPHIAVDLMNKLDVNDDLYRQYYETCYNRFKPVFDRNIILTRVENLIEED